MGKVIFLLLMGQLTAYMMCACLSVCLAAVEEFLPFDPDCLPLISSQQP